jgi:hypothetical protein
VLSPTAKAVALACLAVFLFAIVATGGCSSSATNPVVMPTPSTSPKVSPSPTASPSPTPTANFFVVMNYPSIPPTTDPTFGVVQGYMQVSPAPTASPTSSASPSPSPAPTLSSGIVTVHCNQNIQFTNLDRTSAHTASLLGPATGPSWPPYYQNANNTTPSVVLTAITAPDFSTGNILGGGGKSGVYATGTITGSFQYGDYYDYNPIFPGFPQMRTVITILCP